MKSCYDDDANNRGFNSVERNTAGFPPLQPARGENVVCPLDQFSRRDSAVRSFDYKGHFINEISCRGRILLRMMSFFGSTIEAFPVLFRI